MAAAGGEQPPAAPAGAASEEAGEAAPIAPPQTEIAPAVLPEGAGRAAPGEGD
jgi:hypothetical protein